MAKLLVFAALIASVESFALNAPVQRPVARRAAALTMQQQTKEPETEKKGFFGKVFPTKEEKPAGEEEASVITRSNYRHMYWNMKQQLVHHAVSGCNMVAGDLLGSGTISGADETAFGSMLELSWKGAKEIALENSKSDNVRKFLRDGDECIMPREYAALRV